MLHAGRICGYVWYRATRRLCQRWDWLDELAAAVDLAADKVPGFSSGVMAAYCRREADGAITVTVTRII